MHLWQDLETGLSTKAYWLCRQMIKKQFIT